VSFGTVQARGDALCNGRYNWRICLEYYDNAYLIWTFVRPFGCRSSGVPFGAGYPATSPSSYFVSTPCPKSLWFRTMFQLQYQYDSVRTYYSGQVFRSC
jgi:hypothetical protein